MTSLPVAATEIDVDRVRRETRGCHQVLHFNNAGAALPPDCVHDTVLAHLEDERIGGGYEAQAAATDRLNGLYTGLARLLNADPEEIAFVENATRAWDMAFYAFPWSADDVIVTGETEYASNVLAFLHMARRAGVEIRVAPGDPAGRVDVPALADLIDERVRLIAITHIPSHSGLVNPVAAIGAVAREHGVPFLLDACQSAGQRPLDVQAIGCDMLAGTGRKYLRGPRGTGFLYVRRSLIATLDPPFIDLQAATWIGPRSFEIRADARRFETWEGFIAGRLGLARAVRYALDLGPEAIAARVCSLAERLRAGFAAVPGVTLFDTGPAESGIVTFALAKGEATAAVDQLRSEGINLSVSPPGHARLDRRRQALPALLRASVHYYNTEAEIDRLCERLGRF